mgnify:FL=1
MSDAPRILGLDEAGRGCVLGPLVIGAFCCTVDELDALDATGATDSKKLSAKKREAIRLQLLDIGEHAVELISPQQIDAGNLNQLEEASFIRMLLHFRPTHCIIDAPVHPRGIPALTNRLERAMAEGGVSAPAWTIEPKADLNYRPCGAASIFAKQTRDGIIRDLGPVGSGYPSDPKTRTWLMGFIQRDEPFPDCVRTRWGTIEQLRQQHLFGT